MARKLEDILKQTLGELQFANAFLQAERERLIEEASVLHQAEKAERERAARQAEKTAPRPEKPDAV